MNQVKKATYEIDLPEMGGIYTVEYKLTDDRHPKANTYKIKIGHKASGRTDSGYAEMPYPRGSHAIMTAESFYRKLKSTGEVT